jgi:hypothetical protein
MEKGYYTVNEVCQITGQHPNTVRNKIKRGLYKTMKRSRSGEPYLIAKSSIDVGGENK